MNAATNANSLVTTYAPKIGIFPKVPVLHKDEYNLSDEELNKLYSNAFDKFVETYKGENTLIRDIAVGNYSVVDIVDELDDIGGRWKNMLPRKKDSVYSDISRQLDYFIDASSVFKRKGSFALDNFVNWAIGSSVIAGGLASYSLGVLDSNSTIEVFPYFFIKYLNAIPFA